MTGVPTPAAWSPGCEDRYALVSALGAAGYLPELGESIRYFEWKSTETAATLVPAEWFVPGPRLSTLDQSETHEAQPILVLWLKEQDLGSKPLRTLTSLVSYLKKEMNTSPSGYRVC